MIQIINVLVTIFFVNIISLFKLFFLGKEANKKKRNKKLLKISLCDASLVGHCLFKFNHTNYEIQLIFFSKLCEDNVFKNIVSFCKLIPRS